MCFDHFSAGLTHSLKCRDSWYSGLTIIEAWYGGKPDWNKSWLLHSLAFVLTGQNKWIQSVLVGFGWCQRNCTHLGFKFSAAFWLCEVSQVLKNTNILVDVSTVSTSSLHVLHRTPLWGISTHTHKHIHTALYCIKRAIQRLDGVKDCSLIN